VQTQLARTSTLAPTGAQLGLKNDVAAAGSFFLTLEKPLAVEFYHASGKIGGAPSRLWNAHTFLALRGRERLTQRLTQQATF